MIVERGPYLTENRTLRLERDIARLEGRIDGRLDELERRLARERQRNDLHARLLKALMDTLNVKED